MRYETNEETFEHINGTIIQDRNDRFITCGNLQKGTYLIYIENLDKSKSFKGHELTISCYGAGITEILKHDITCVGL